MKKILIIALGAGAVYLLYKSFQQNKEKTLPITNNDAGKEIAPKPVMVCPEGEIVCPNNPNKCFNPSVKYIVNPCEKTI